MPGPVLIIAGIGYGNNTAVSVVVCPSADYIGYGVRLPAAVGLKIKYFLKPWKQIA